VGACELTGAEPMNHWTNRMVVAIRTQPLTHARGRAVSDEYWFITDNMVIGDLVQCLSYFTCDTSPSCQVPE